MQSKQIIYINNKQSKNKRIIIDKQIGIKTNKKLMQNNNNDNNYGKIYSVEGLCFIIVASIAIIFYSANSLQVWSTVFP